MVIEQLNMIQSVHRFLASWRQGFKFVQYYSANPFYIFLYFRQENNAFTFFYLLSLVLFILVLFILLGRNIIHKILLLFLWVLCGIILKKPKKNIANCNLCSKEIKTSGTTSNLIAHLKTKHLFAYKDCLKKKNLGVSYISFKIEVN